MWTDIEKIQKIIEMQTSETMNNIITHLEIANRHCCSRLCRFSFANRSVYERLLKLGNRLVKDR